MESMFFSCCSDQTQMTHADMVEFSKHFWSVNTLMPYKKETMILCMFKG